MEMLIQFVPIILMFGVLYLVLILPEKKRRKKYEEMLNELKVNDEVMTRGGVIGKIISIDDENMVLESGPNSVRLKFSKNAVANKINN